jgi:hypothetical protein
VLDVLLYIIDGDLEFSFILGSLEAIVNTRLPPQTAGPIADF